MYIRCGCLQHTHMHAQTRTHAHTHTYLPNMTKMKQKQNLITFAAATEPQMRHRHISFIGNAKQAELLAMACSLKRRHRSCLPFLSLSPIPRPSSDKSPKLWLLHPKIRKALCTPNVRTRTYSTLTHSPGYSHLYSISCVHAYTCMYLVNVVRFSRFATIILYSRRR